MWPLQRTQASHGRASLTIHAWSILAWSPVGSLLGFLGDSPARASSPAAFAEQTLLSETLASCLVTGAPRVWWRAPGQMGRWQAVEKSGGLNQAMFRKGEVQRPWPRRSIDKWPVGSLRSQHSCPWPACGTWMPFNCQEHCNLDYSLLCFLGISFW